MTKKFYITTPIYYVNARPHIGHAYTTLACDTIARRHRMLGDDTWFLTGTDEHGQKIERAAQAAGKTPQQFTDEISAEFRALWEAHGPDPTISSAPLPTATSKACRRCGARFAITVTSTKEPTPANTACPTSFMWTASAPATPAPIADAPPKPSAKRITISSSRPFRINLIRLYTEQPDFIRPETRRNEVLAFVRGGLRDLSISRSTFSWGIPVPDDPKHVVYVWLDALANYITALGYGSGDSTKFDKYWPADVHMIGKEIVRFHCVYWPAFLLAAGLPLPKCITAHGWLLFEESKMSKSRGNIVRAETIVDVLGTDALRYFLLREVVFGQDGSFSFDALVQRYNSDLANGLGNLASRTLTMITRYFKGEVPYPSHTAHTPADDAIAETAKKAIADFGAYSININSRARSKPPGRWSALSTNTLSKTNPGRWARNRTKKAVRAWPPSSTPAPKPCAS
jgi:methionyl-tRNA synthetase